MAIKLPKQFTAGFSTSKKPTVPVEIDWSNPLTKGLIFAPHWKESGLINLVNGEQFSSTHNDTHRLKQGGMYTYVSSASVYLHQDLATETYTVDSTSELTVLCDMNFDNLSSNDENTLVRLDSGAGDYQYALGVYPSVKKIRGLLTTVGTTGWTASVDFTESNIASGISQQYGMTYKNGDSIQYYFEGDNVSSYGATGNIADRTTSKLTLMGGYHSAAFSPQGLMNYVYIWNRALSPEEVKSLNENPYQILKPVIPQYAIFESAIGSQAVNDAFEIAWDTQLVGNVLTNDTTNCA